MSEARTVEGRKAELRAEVAREERFASAQRASAQHQQALEQAVSQAFSAVEAHVDGELHRLDMAVHDENELEALRARRMEQLRRRHKRAEEWRAAGHGGVERVAEERTFFQAVKRSDRAVVHFARDATRRCEVVDGHLDVLARAHMETKFMRVDAEKCPFLSERLLIRVLPSIVLVKNGKSVHTIIGFDELGGTDDFSTQDLEAVLVHWEVCDEGAAPAPPPPPPKIRQSNIKLTDDWED